MIWPFKRKKPSAPTPQPRYRRKLVPCDGKVSLVVEHGLGAWVCDSCDEWSAEESGVPLYEGHMKTIFVENRPDFDERGRK